MGRLYNQSVLNEIGDAIQERYRPKPWHTCAAVTNIIWEVCSNASIIVITPREKVGQYWPYRFEVRFGNSSMTFPQPGQAPILCAKFDEAVAYVLDTHGPDHPDPRIDPVLPIA